MWRDPMLRKKTTPLFLLIFFIFLSNPGHSISNIILIDENFDSFGSIEDSNWTEVNGLWELKTDINGKFVEGAGSHAYFQVPTNIRGRFFERIEIHFSVKLKSDGGYASAILQNEEGDSNLKFTVAKKNDDFEKIDIRAKKNGRTDGCLRFSMETSIPACNTEWLKIKCVLGQNNHYELWVNGEKQLEGDHFMGRRLLYRDFKYLKFYLRKGIKAFDNLRLIGITDEFNVKTIQDTFSDGNFTHDPAWKVEGGDWSIISDPAHSYVKSASSHSRMEIPTGINSHYVEQVEIGGKIRLFDTTGYAAFFLANETGNSYLKFIIGKEGGQYSEEIAIEARKNGITTFRKTAPPIADAPNKWYEVKCIWSNDNSYELWIDGEKKISGSDLDDNVQLADFKWFQLYSRSGIVDFDDIQFSLNNFNSLVFDSFTDGDLYLNPSWTPNNSQRYQIIKHSTQHNDEDSWLELGIGDTRAFAYTDLTSPKTINNEKKINLKVKNFIPERRRQPKQSCPVLYF